MATLQEFNEALIKYIKPQSYPVVARLCSSREEIPKRARFPKRDMNMEMPLCQAVGMARRYALTVALGIEDMNCPGAAVSLGFVPAKKRYLEGEFSANDKIPQESYATHNRALPRLEYGKYKYVVVAPIHRTDLEPHLVIIYGFPVQISLLAQSAVLRTGKALNSDHGLGTFCSPMFAATLVDNECQVSIPCGGDRLWGSSQDYEVGFSVPQSKLDEIIEGLEILYKTGTYRYPTITNLWFQAQNPESYKKAMEYLKQEGE